MPGRQQHHARMCLSAERPQRNEQDGLLTTSSQLQTSAPHGTRGNPSFGSHVRSPYGGSAGVDTHGVQERSTVSLHPNIPHAVHDRQLGRGSRTAHRSHPTSSWSPQHRPAHRRRVRAATTSCNMALRPSSALNRVAVGVAPDAIGVRAIGRPPSPFKWTDKGVNTTTRRAVRWPAARAMLGGRPREPAQARPLGSIRPSSCPLRFGEIPCVRSGQSPTREHFSPNSQQRSAHQAGSSSDPAALHAVHA